MRSHDRPLSTAARALGAAGVNIEGLSGPSTVDDKLIGHLLVEDVVAATRALEEAGVGVAGQQDVLVTTIEDRPGALAELWERAALFSVAFAYMTTRREIVVGFDDPAQLQAAREKLAE